MLHLPSNAKAKHRSTWPWRQVNQPWLRATLHPVKMCLNVAGDEHKGQEGSFLFTDLIVGSLVGIFSIC